MASRKTSGFKAQDSELARYADALSHPARIAILKALAERKECVCGEIVGWIPLAQSTVSQHLKVLKKAGLIQGEVDGPRSCYCVNRKTVKRLSLFFHGWLTAMQTPKGKAVEKSRSSR